MPTLAIMFTISTYGTWLRGDARGWVSGGTIFPPDPQLQANDRARLKYPVYLFPRHIRHDVGQAIGDSLGSRLTINLLALCVQSWHVHFVTPATGHDVGKIVKCAKDAARWKLRIDRPIWGADYDKRFCFTPDVVRARINYVEQHNLRGRLPRRPWSFIHDWHEPTISSFSPR